MYLLAFRLVFSNLKQKIFSRIIVILSVAFILMVNASLILLLERFSNLLTEVNRSYFLTVYLEPSVSPTREIEVLSAIRKIPGVGNAQLVSRDAFLRNFSKYFPKLTNEVANIDLDVIPRYIKVSARDDAKELHKIRTQIAKFSSVEQIEISKNKYASLVSALSSFRKLMAVLLLGTTLCLVCVMLNHFKLGMAMQNKVQQIFAYQGARIRHIFIPYVLEGAIEGGLGGVLSAVGIFFMAGMFNTQIGNLFSSMGVDNTIFVTNGHEPPTFLLTTTTTALLLVLAGLLSGTLVSIWAGLRVQKR